MSTADASANSTEIGRKKRKLEDAEIDITPMIDIVFLLLAFFVMVSKMDPSTAVKMPRAKNGDSVRDANCVVIVVRTSPNDSPLVFLGKSAKEGGQLQGEAEDISDAITEFVKNELRLNAEKTTVLIKAERQVKSRHVSMVKSAVSEGLDIESGQQRMFVGIEEE